MSTGILVAIMRLLRMVVEGLEPFENQTLALDLYARDQVRSKTPGNGLTYLENSPGSHIYAQNVLCLTGINASGKTTALNALALAVSILSRDASPMLSSVRSLSAFGPSLQISLVFESKQHFYLLKSQLDAVRNDNTDESTDPLADSTYKFSQEQLWRYPSKPLPKSVLRSTDAFQQRSKLIKVRRLATQFPGGATPDAYLTKEAFDYLSPHSSIVLPYTRTTRTQVIARIGPETYFPIVPADTIADPVLHVFDDSIDYFHIDQEHRAHLRFAGTSQEVVMSNMDTAGLLSLGTVRGSRIVKAAIRVLRTGGYLLIDEIENSINKELVRMIINLFMSTTSNPHGATLMFTTHYAELLDLIQRKDNIYFLRRSEDKRKGIQAINYSEAVRRGELKHSEVFLSNYIGGTAPKAAELKAMRQYVADQVAKQEHHA